MSDGETFRQLARAFKLELKLVPPLRQQALERHLFGVGDHRGEKKSKLNYIESTDGVPRDIFNRPLPPFPPT